MRYQTDPVDFACEAWAFQWIDQFARLPVKSSQQLGRVGSTLDLIKLMGDGAGASGWVTQIFPEVFFGDGLVVACALKFMRERDREMVWHHYVDRWFFARVVPVKTADGRAVYHHTTVATVPQDRPDSPLRAQKLDDGAVVRTYARAQFVGPGKPVEVNVVDRARPDTQVLIERRFRPMKQQTMADRLGISRMEYHRRRDRVKAYLRGVLDGPKCCYTKVGHETPVRV